MSDEDASSAEMRRPPTDPLALDEETVERLLAGDLPPALAPPGYGEVAALLAAAAGPPSPGELAGEQAVLAELRAVTRARRAAGSRRAGRARRRRRVGLAAVVVAGALATGGVAAAATGHLPEPVREVTRRILGTVGGTEGGPVAPVTPGREPAPAASSSPGSGGARPGGQGPQPTGATGHGPGPTGAGPAATPDLAGLCRAYLAATGKGQDRNLDAAAFQTLTRAAGGADKVAAFCEQSDMGSPGGSGQGYGQPGQPGDEQNGGPPPSSGQGSPPQNAPPPSSNGGNQGQG